MRALTTSIRDEARGGFTLIEICIGCTVLALFVGAIGTVVLSARGVYQQGLCSATIDAQARRTVQRLASELTGAVASTFNPVPIAAASISTLEYRKCTGFAAGAQTLGPLTRIELRADPHDADDGVDNDGDGLTDEHEILLVRDVGQPEETEAIICGNVRRLLQGEIQNLADDNANGLIDERGLSIVMDANRTITIRLTVEGRDPHGLVVARTVETSVHVRN